MSASPETSSVVSFNQAWAADLLKQYRETLLLPDREVCRVRLEGLDQKWVDAGFSRQWWSARPQVRLSFAPADQDIRPRGVRVSGAPVDHPGHILMEEQAFSKKDASLDDYIVHHLAVLFHEVAHFDFERQSRHQMLTAWTGLVNVDFVEGLVDHVWAPFLRNHERRRLDETYADVSSCLWLHEFDIPGAAREIENLRIRRHHDYQQALDKWAPGEDFTFPHASSRALEHVQKSLASQNRRGSIGEQIWNLTALGTRDRWSDQWSCSQVSTTLSWDQVHFPVLTESLLYASRNKSWSTIENWISNYPEHPVPQTLARMRWSLPRNTRISERWLDQQAEYLSETLAAWTEGSWERWEKSIPFSQRPIRPRSSLRR